MMTELFPVMDEAGLPARNTAGGLSVDFVGLQVLIVEDDEADAYLLSRALNNHPYVADVVRARDGVEALELLDDGMVEPDLAIIDLNLPRKGGLTLLVDLACRHDGDFSKAVLTSSAARADLMRSRLRGANLVMTKPSSFEELQDMVAQIVEAV